MNDVSHARGVPFKVVARHVLMRLLDRRHRAAGMRLEGSMLTWDARTNTGGTDGTNAGLAFVGPLLLCLSMKTTPWMLAGLVFALAAMTLLVYGAVLVRRGRQGRAKDNVPSDV
jgi:hypothetical protein